MKFKVKKRVQAVFEACGFAVKAKDKKMTNADWSAFQSAYKEKYGVSLEEDIEQADSEAESKLSEELQQQIIGLATEITGTKAEDEEEEEEEDDKEAAGDEEEEKEKEKDGKGKKSKKATKNKAQGGLSLEASMAVLASTMQKLMGQGESSAPAGVFKAVDNSVHTRVLGMCPHSATHLFDIDSPVFSRSAWYNQSAITRKPANTSYTTEQVSQFKKAFNEYAHSLKARVDELSANNQVGLLDFKQMAAGQTSIEYSNLTVEFGNEFLVRRQDMIIAYLRTLPTVDHIFPWRSGIQDGEYVPTAFFGEFSQRYQAGEVFKGSVKLPPQIARVSDVMIKYKFEDLIDLEKQYIGYLNKEHSNVMKWAFIEWLLVHFYTAMMNEQNRRRVVGTLVPVQKGVDNPAMFAANGGLAAIDMVEEEFRVLPFKDLKVYDNSTIVDYVETFFEHVNMILPSLERWKLHINQKHVAWYRQNFREKYSTDTDFTGTKLQAIDYSLENFVPVPNMAHNDYRMWMTLPGNVESLQDAPNEMYDIYFERRLEALLAMSRWKEGSVVNMSGFPCKDEKELEGTGRQYQWIFTNFPVTVLNADTTIVDGLLNTNFVTGENSVETVIADIKNAPADRVIKIVCGSTENATQIKKSGKFTNLKEDWIPKAEGDFIKLYPELHTVEKEINGKTFEVTEPTGKWFELSRRVSK